MKKSSIRASVSQLAQVSHHFTRVDFLLIEAIHYFQQRFGTAFPGRELLAKQCGCSIWTVSRHVSKLRKLGVLEVTHRKLRKKDGTWKTQTNVYRVLSTTGEKIRSLLNTIFADVRKNARILTEQKKEEITYREDLSFMKNECIRGKLEAFAKRGEAVFAT